MSKESIKLFLLYILNYIEDIVLLESEISGNK